MSNSVGVEKIGEVPDSLQASIVALVGAFEEAKTVGLARDKNTADDQSRTQKKIGGLKGLSALIILAVTIFGSVGGWVLERYDGKVTAMQAQYERKEQKLAKKLTEHISTQDVINEAAKWNAVRTQLLLENLIRDAGGKVPEKTQAQKDAETAAGIPTIDLP